MNRITTVLLLLLASASGLMADPAAKPDGISAVFTTSRGTFTVQLDPVAAPMAVTLFVGLAEGPLNPITAGEPFYRNQVFHSKTAGVVIQGGDPTGQGQTIVGGPVPNESGVDYDKAGVLGLFNLDPGKNGSQFFISLAPIPQLKGRYTGFGRVTEGMDVVNTLDKGDQLVSVQIVRTGAPALAFKADRAALDALLANAQAQAEALVTKVSVGTQTSETGLRYKVLRQAPAVRKPKVGQTVTVDYKGTFTDGTLFDTSIGKPAPFQFEVGKQKVIAAWDEAILDMSVGEKRLLVVPPSLGYGSKGMPPAIPPESWLVFEVELIGIRG